MSEFKNESENASAQAEAEKTPFSFEGADKNQINTETSGDQKLNSEAPPQAVTPELEEWKARVAYLAAEVENMRKRFAREKIEIIRLANEDLLKKLLPVFDNLELASKAARSQMSKLESQVKDSGVFENLVKGVEMTYKHFEQTLEGVGVKAIKTVGEVFNPTVHEAVSQDQDSQKPHNTIINEFQKGFDFQGRILRPARVVVNTIMQAVKGEPTQDSTSQKETPSSN